MSQTVTDFINDYQGFNFQDGEIVIVDQRSGKQIICKVETKDAFRRIEGDKLADDTILLSAGITADYWMPGVYRRQVWNWTHTFKTMLIIV